MHTVGSKRFAQEARELGIVSVAAAFDHDVRGNVVARHDRGARTPTDMKASTLQLDMQALGLRHRQVRDLAWDERATLQTREVRKTQIRKQEYDQTDQKVDERHEWQLVIDASARVPRCGVDGRHAELRHAQRLIL